MNSFGAGGEMTFSKACKQYQYNLKLQNGNQLKTADLMISKWGKKEFSKDEEWIAFLDYCQSHLKNEPKEDYTYICFLIGENLELNGFPQEAFVYLLRVDDLIANKPPDQISYYYRFHERIGLVYYGFKRYWHAKKHFELLYNDKKTPLSIKINSCNAIGLVYRMSHQTDSSRFYFERALLLAKQYKQEDWIGVLSGNLGNYYFEQKVFGKAKELIEIDFEISTKTKQWESAMNAIILLAEIEIIYHNFENAELKLVKAKSLMDHYFHEKQVQSLYWKTMTLLHEKKGNYSEAFKSQKIYLAYLDTVNEQENLVNFHNTEFQIQFQKKQLQIKLLDTKKKRVEQLFFLSTIVVCLVIIGLIIIIRQISLKKRKEKELLTLQKLRAEDELNNIESQMHLVLSNLSEKNELVNELQSEIEQFNKVSAHQFTEEEQLALLDKLQSFRLLTTDDWDIFKRLFEKLHPGFFERFENLSDLITKADLRLATLIRLKLSPSEIAGVLGISTESVQRTHLRLRKKMGMEQPQELDQLIRSL